MKRIVTVFDVIDPKTVKTEMLENGDIKMTAKTIPLKFSKDTPKFFHGSTGGS